MKFKGPLELLEKYLSGKASPEERAKVEQWYASFEEKKAAMGEGDDLNAIREKMYRKIADELNLQEPVIPFYRKLNFRLTAAAILILLIGSYFIFSTQQKTNTISSATAKPLLKNDITPPASNKATLILADGKTIELDSSANGTLAVQGKINIVKQNDGLIAYTGKPGDKISYNTLTVPRGSKPMKLLLADGSEVWLNVASSVTYPTAFVGGERRVEVTGEVYFEVANDAKKPFRVFISPLAGEPDGAEIEVLGTHFNVNAYSEEPNIKTTLLEGSVKIKKANVVQMLSPGQQARLTSIGITLEKNVDVSQVVAWKDGFFWFDNTDLPTLMRQVTRWYDMDVNFEGQITEDGFTGKISRNVPLSKFLKVLELNDVHIRIEGRNITVIP